jgi:hypothetical protein
MTLAQTYHCAVDPSIVGTPDRWLFFGIFRGSAFAIPFDVLDGSEPCPLEAHFRVRNTQKSLGAKSGDYGGWVPFSERDFYTTSDVWFDATS